MAEAMRTGAVNLNVSDREHDALRRAQRAHEPSMEEILASIRTIIAEERQPARASDPKGAPAAATAGPLAPQIVYSKGEASPRGPAAVTPHRSEPDADANAPKALRRQAEPEAAFAPASPGADDALLSPEAGKAVASAFDALSANLAARSAELAEEVAREMLRPMLKTWLDENLPAIVERLVQAEIERIARAAR